MDAGFDEDEWRASAKDGPSFQFAPGKGGATEAPRFEPEEPEPAEEDQAHQEAWRQAEPSWGEARRPHQAEARRPGLPSAEDRNFAMVSHAAGAVGELLTGGLVGWLVPLILYLVKKDEGGFAAEQAREALNFQITMWIWWGVGMLLTMTIIGAIVGVPMMLLAWIFNVIFSIVGAVRTFRGEAYRYPVNMRLVGGDVV